MTAKRDRGKSKEAEIEAVATELDGLLEELAEAVAGIGAILKRSKQPPPDSNVKVVRDE